MGAGRIRVRLRAYASLRQYLPPGPLGAAVDLYLPEGSKLAEALQNLGMPAEQVKQCFVNGRQQGLDYCLRDGDEIGVFPPIGGGGQVA